MEKMMDGELPEDIIRLILVNLRDVKCLVRMKLVSKSWHEFISSSRFAAEYHMKNYYSPGRGNCNSLLSFLILRKSRSPTALNFFSLISLDEADLKHISTKKDIHMPYVNCKNESPYSLPTIFDVGYGVYSIFDFSTNKVALWNPNIRELKFLPPAPSPFYCAIDEATTYPDHHRQILGFGYVEHENDHEARFNYKVGRLIIRNDMIKKYLLYFSIEFYSSTTSAWKVLSDCYQVERYGREASWSFLVVDGTNLNGRFHWFSWFSEKDPHIIWFDYSSENIGRIELHADVFKRRRYKFSASLLTRFDNQFLCLVLCWESRRRNTYFDVWVMREYGVTNYWMKKHTVGPIPEDMCILGFWNKVQGIFLQDFEKGNRLFLCDCRSSGVENLSIGSVENIGFDSEVWEDMTVLEYTSSLVSFNGESDETQYSELRYGHIF